MSDREPPNAPKVPRTGDFQQKDLDELKDELERVLRAYVGRYLVHRLAMEYGPDVKLPDWIALMTRDCPRQQSPGLADACAAQCPDLLGLAIEDASEDPSASRHSSDSRAAGADRSKID